MTIQQFARALISLSLLVLAVGAPAAPNLSDAEVAKIAKRGLGETPATLPLGEFGVYGGLGGQGKGSNLAKHELSEGQFHEVEAWRDAGLVRITVLWDYADKSTQNSGGWKALNQVISSDVVKRVRIEATPRGIELQRDSGLSREQEILSYLEGDVTVESVVKNEPRSFGTDDYRLVMLTYRRKWVPEARAIEEARTGIAPQDARKLIILLRFDPFKRSWNPVAADYANLDGEFRTKNVERYSLEREGSKR